MTEPITMPAPIQAKPMPRPFMQEIVGRHWTPEAERRFAEKAAGIEPRPRKGRARKEAEPACLRQLMTFAVGRGR